MLKRKNIKSRGKIQFGTYFQELKDGDKVAVIKEHTFSPAFPERIQGRTGTISGKRGSAYLVKIQEGGLAKVHIIKPANLKKLL